MKDIGRETMFERIYINDAANQIGYKDKRSFRRWCNNNGVGLLNDTGCTKLYVVKSEFEEAMIRSTLKHLNQKSKRMIVIERGNAVVAIDKYKTSGLYEKQFSERLTKLIHE